VGGSVCCVRYFANILSALFEENPCVFPAEDALVRDASPELLIEEIRLLVDESILKSFSHLSSGSLKGSTSSPDSPETLSLSRCWG